MTPERFKRITQALKHRQFDLVVVTDQVYKGRNLSAIIRTCDAIGVDTVYSVTPEREPHLYRGASATADKWVTVETSPCVTLPLNHFKKLGYQIVAAHLSDRAVDYREVDYTKPTVLVLGAELDGVSEAAQQIVDHDVVIPMFGMVESLNVSVACAVILSEARNQRETAGFYRQQRLPQSLYSARFFNWAHPKLAAFCEENQLEFPPVDDHGEVVALPQWYAKVRAQRLAEEQCNNTNVDRRCCAKAEGESCGEKKGPTVSGETSGQDH